MASSSPSALIVYRYTREPGGTVLSEGRLNQSSTVEASVAWNFTVISREAAPCKWRPAFVPNFSLILGAFMSMQPTPS